MLVHTGWDEHWGTDDYFSGHPHLTERAATYLRDQGARLVGIDSLNIDNTDGGTRPVHSVLLAAGIPIVEHLCNLAAVPADGFDFTAAPPKVDHMGTFPVRAHAIPRPQTGERNESGFVTDPPALTQLPVVTPPAAGLILRSVPEHGRHPGCGCRPC